MSLKERILKTLENAGISPIIASFAFAQFAHETGNFSSPVYIANKNLCGMRMPKKRKTVATGEKLGYAKYDTVEDSATDWSLWYKYVNLPNAPITIEAFVSGLKSKAYFEDDYDRYLSGVKYWYSKYFAG